MVIYETRESNVQGSDSRDATLHVILRSLGVKLFSNIRKPEKWQSSYFHFRGINEMAEAKTEN